MLPHLLTVCVIVSQNDGKPVKKFCPHHLVNSDVKANVTCAVYNYNGSGQRLHVFMPNATVSQDDACTLKNLGRLI